MELTLNLAWTLLAVVIVCLWTRYAPRAGADRRLQFVALAVLILILFPVISVTDDLMAAQNPAEDDCCLRRDYAVSSAAHSTIPSMAALPQPVFTELPFAFLPFVAPGYRPVPVSDVPALAAIQNRPPPAA